MFQVVGNDVLLDVNTEMSTLDAPSTIRKMVSKGNALAAPGKSVLVTTMEDDGKSYKLTVTPTKLQ